MGIRWRGRTAALTLQEGVAEQLQPLEHLAIYLFVAPRAALAQQVGPILKAGLRMEGVADGFHGFHGFRIRACLRPFHVLHRRLQHGGCISQLSVGDLLLRALAAHKRAKEGKGGIKPTGERLATVLLRRVLNLRHAERTHHRLHQVRLSLGRHQLLGHIRQALLRLKRAEEREARRLDALPLPPEILIHEQQLRLRIERLHAPFMQCHHERLGEQIQSGVAQPLEHLVVATASCIHARCVESWPNSSGLQIVRRQRRLWRLGRGFAVGQRRSKQRQRHRSQVTWKPLLAHRVQGAQAFQLCEQSQMLHAPHEGTQAVQRVNVG